MTTGICVILIVLLVLNCLIEVESLTTRYEDPDVNKQHGRLQYTRDELLLLSGHSYDFPGQINLPDDIKRVRKRVRKRGRRGGVRARCRRRGSRLPMPMIVTGNARSIRNKIDELSAQVRWNHAFRESSVICITETWLQDTDPDTAFTLEGYTLVRGDRTAAAGKTTGGGVCAYINNRWCNNITVHEQFCQVDIEYLTLSLRPYYLPREFTKIYLTLVYIPPCANVKSAENTLNDAICRMQNCNPDAINIITGDFNQCNFQHCVPDFKQYINFSTRSDKLLDHFYCNIKNAYIAKKLSPLGISDHNMCHLIPVYRQLIKRCKPIEKVVYSWNEEVNSTLLGCMECTDFDVLYNDDEDLDQNVEVLNDYLNFCVEVVVPKRVVKCFANNKPWVTKDLKMLLNKKKRLLGTNDREQLKCVQKEINLQISLCKRNYKEKMESMFRTDSKSAWNGLRTITGMKKSKNVPDVENVNVFCNELNHFYARFDNHNFATVRTYISNFLRSRESRPIYLSIDEVLKSLDSIKIGKAAGPDGIGSSVIKLCKEPLAPVLCRIYQKSLDSAYIPKIWKTSEVVPAPKKNPPKCNNDYRPIALTAIMMKCLEKIVKNHLTVQVKPYTDNYQFAYTAHRCVEDATLSLTDFVLHHVDKPNNARQKKFIKILFVDFSSAFNTIQPHIMMQKLINMNVNPSLILWIESFLTDRPQYVKFNDVKSDVVITNTGAPQGCVLSPVLFTLYTSDCKCNHDSNRLFKYADDTALVSKCLNDDVKYREDVNNFIEWCENNYLELNVKKTKEMTVDFRTTPYVHPPLYIKDEQVENVCEYKYLGTVIDHQFTFNQNVDAIHKKVKSRLYFVRQLGKLNVDNTIMELFYRAIVQSIMSFSIICWYGNCSSESKLKLTRIIEMCGRLGVENAQSLDDIYTKCLVQRCKVIVNDELHPLHASYALLPSGRRWRSIKARTARYAKSFVPSSIRVLNELKLNVLSI